MIYNKFQFSSLFTKYRLFCRILGAIQHYGWLCAFAWMCTISHDTWRTFSSLSCASVALHHSTLPINRYLFSYIIPAVFVLSCYVTAEFWSGFPISYGSDTMCFISSGRLYAFACPVATCSAFNMVAFLLTVISLSRHADNSNSLRGDSPQTDGIASWPIYLRLASLMGFTWIFGLLAMASDWSPLWYVFVILNSVQGAFIAASFALSEHSRSLWSSSCNMECLAMKKFSESSTSNRQKRFGNNSKTSSTNSRTNSTSELKLSSLKDSRREVI